LHQVRKVVLCKYTLEIVEDSGYLAAKRISFNMDSNLKLSRVEAFSLKILQSIEDCWIGLLTILSEN
jgi:hypothetical protein